MSDTDTRTKPRLSTNGGEHEMFSHIVKRPAHVKMSAKDYIAWAMIEGFEVEALCGKRWIPARDPERCPVCPSCRDILSAMK